MVVGVTTGVEYGARHSWLFWVEHWTSDWRATFLSDRPKGQHPRIAVINVTEDSIQQYAYRTPIDRGLVARLVTAIDKAGAEAIAIDFFVPENNRAAKGRTVDRGNKGRKGPCCRCRR